MLNNYYQRYIILLTVNISINGKHLLLTVNDFINNE